MAHPFAADEPAPCRAGEPVPLPRAPVVNYREYYSEPSNSPAPERVRGYLNGYRITDPNGGGIPTPAALRDQTVTMSDRQPMTFLCLTPGVEEESEVRIVHRLLRYMDMPGDHPLGTTTECSDYSGI